MLHFNTVRFGHWGGKRAIFERRELCVSRHRLFSSVEKWDGETMTWNFCPVFVLFSHLLFLLLLLFFHGKPMHFFLIFVASSLGAISSRRKHNMRALRRFNYHKNIIRANLNLKHCVSAVVLPSQENIVSLF